MMGEMEHGRWNTERLEAGWKYGRERDSKDKTNPCLVPWRGFSENIKEYDRKAMRDWPVILKKVGLEICQARRTCVEIDSGIRMTTTRAIQKSDPENRAADMVNHDLLLSEWQGSSGSLRECNRQQADDILGKLQCWSVDKVHYRTFEQTALTEEEIEAMAKIRQECWNAERFRDGWRLGEARNAIRETSPYLLDWADLSDNLRDWDAETVTKISKFMARAGLGARPV
jgi:hypothetical protein